MTLTEEQMVETCQFISSCPQIIHTPTINQAHKFLQVPTESMRNVLSRVLNLSLKMENLQTTGSFKMRGLANQKRYLPKDVLSGDKSAITMSAGNYGKAFGCLLQEINLKGICIMPLTAPAVRVEIVQSYGVEVELVPTRDMVSVVNQYVNQRSCHFMHSYDDISLVAGYTSIGEEILNDVPDVDIILVGCGGGALLSGIATRVKCTNPKCRVYGVEPEYANTMHESLRQKTPVSLKGAKSVAGGLAPPSAGTIPFAHCEKYVDGILLVSETEIINAVSVLFHSKFIVEPAGCASLAALLHGKVPDFEDKNIVVVLSGGNITMDELLSMIN